MYFFYTIISHSLYALPKLQHNNIYFISSILYTESPLSTVSGTCGHPESGNK